LAPHDPQKPLPDKIPATAASLRTRTFVAALQPHPACTNALIQKKKKNAKEGEKKAQKMRFEVLPPLMHYLATDWPFPEVSRLTVVSRSWRTTVLESLKTANHLILRGQFAKSVRDGDVRLVFFENKTLLK
jgi:hypothetical protein